LWTPKLISSFCGLKVHFKLLWDQSSFQAFVDSKFIANFCRIKASCKLEKAVKASFIFLIAFRLKSLRDKLATFKFAFSLLATIFHLLSRFLHRPPTFLSIFIPLAHFHQLSYTLMRIKSRKKVKICETKKDEQENHNFLSFSNLEGIKLANESLDGFLQLLCPFEFSTFETVCEDGFADASPLPADGIMSNN
jgi:hypothetical protein